MSLYLSRPTATRSAASPWERRIDTAVSPEEVVELTREYLAAFSPEYLGRLPPECRPVSIKYEDDIEYWAHRLSQHYCGENEEPTDGNLLRDVLDYFLHALIRLAQLHRNLPGPARIKAQ